MKDRSILGFGLIGTALVPLCCITPTLVILVGIAGVSAITGYLDYVLMPALMFFAGLTACALWRWQRAASCCAPATDGKEGI